MAGEVVARSDSHSPGAAPATLIGIVLLALSRVAGAGEVILDVLSLRGTGEQQVARDLGQPEECGETYQGTRCRYRDGIEITFIDGRADWIQVAPEGEIPFEPRAIRHLGLLTVPPAIRNPFRMHWIGHHGLEVVTVLGSGHYVALFQVQAYTR